jgi:iron complex outermembrane receptor protein
VALDYKINPNVSTYGTVRRGYKAGGINITGEPSRKTYQPEFVTDYAAGLKSKWNVDGVAILANVEVYYDRYTNIQRSITAIGADPTPFVSNAASAKIWGIDLETKFVPSEYFDMGINYSLLKPSYDSYTDAQFGNLVNSKFPLAPTHQLSVTPAGHKPLGDRYGIVSLSATLFYQSDFAADVTNTPNGNPNNDVSIPGSLRPGFARLDARLEWEKVMQLPLSIAFVVRNATNKIYQLGGTNNLATPTFGVATAIYGEPRIWSVEMRYHF